ncbi:MAG: hypothetical protein SGPRY_002184 [Prymnesium sp.]
MREKLTALSSEEKMQSLFDQWDKNHDGMIDVHEFKKAMGDLDPRALRCVSPPGVERSAAQAAILSRRLYALLLAVLRKRPKRISVERIVSGPGISSVYSFLLDEAFMKATGGNGSAVVAQCAKEGQVVCKKAIDIFNECYGSEVLVSLSHPGDVALRCNPTVGVAALKWLPFGGLYISGGIAAKNPHWIQSEEFQHAYKDKGRMSVLVKSVPLFLVLTEDTGERGALFYAVQLLP